MDKFLFWDDGCISKEVVESYSNSWKKPALFRERVKKYGVQEVNVVGRSPLYFLSGVHDSAHLHGVLGGSKPTGFGTPSAPAAHAASVACRMFSLPAKPAAPAALCGGVQVIARSGRLRPP